MGKYYILDGRMVIQTDDLLEWAIWIETADRRVAQTLVDGFTISTVFLGLSHGQGIGGPLLFETMVFSPDRVSLEMDRYSTWEEAEAGHCRFVEEYQRKSQRAGSIVDSFMRLLRRKREP